MLPRTQILNASDTSIGITQDISTRSLQTVSVGDSAGKISSGTNNAFIGVQAGAQNTTGSYVTAIGFQAGAQNNNSSFATMIGAYAGAQNLSGNEVVFAGFRAGELNKFGGQHVGIGAYALRENISGNASVAVGYRAGERTLDGGYNTMIGAYSGQDNRSGNFNTMGGYSAGRSAFLGNENTYFGAYAGYSNSRGSGNSLLGYRSGANLKFGDLNVAIGAFSLESATYAYSNVAIGPFAGKNQSGNSVNNVLIGTDVATNSQTKNSVIIGTSAGKNLIGSGLVIIGSDAANSSTIIHGNCNILIGTGANLFNDSNNFAIAIGNLNTLTYTNSVSIGININNESQNSVIIGNTLTSDAPQSVVIGNDISLQSVKFFKDPLYYSYRSIASTDASNIFNITNIDYTDTLISPLGEIYQNATATIISSNVVNSITNRQLNTIGPPRIRNQLPYNLIQTASNYNSNYAYAHSTFYSIRNIADTSNIIDITNKFHTDAIYINSNLPNPPFQLSNYYYIHELNPFIRFVGETSNVTYSSNNRIISFNCNLPLNPVIVNFTQLNPPTLISPVYIAKTITPPIFNFRGLNINQPTSLLKSPEIPINTQINNWNYTVNSNLGINIPDCNVVYTLSKLPKYGKLNNTIYNINTIQSIIYTPFPEYAHNTSDSFEIMPVFSINDYNASNYGLQASNGVVFNIAFTPSQYEIYQANQITFETGTLKTLSLNDILLDAIPLFNSNTMYFNVTYLDTNTTILSNQVEFTSSDIAQMNSKNIAAYPASLAPLLYNTTVNSINVATLCNLDYYKTNHLPILFSMSNDSSNLYNAFLLDPSVQLDKIQSISNIYRSTQKLINLVPISSDLTKNLSDDLSMQISTWNTVYDPVQVYIETTNLLTNYQNFYGNYFQNQLFNVWSNLNVIKPLFPTTYPIPQNVATNLLQTLVNTNNIFNNNNYLNAILNGAQYYTNQIYPSYNTLYDKYYNCPRLFITYNDLQTSNIKIKQSSNITTSHIDFVIDTSNITIPIYTHSNIKTLENIQETLTVNISNSSCNIYTSNLQLSDFSDYFIQTTSSNAILIADSVYINNPWNKSSYFDITVNSNNKYLTKHFQYIYDSSIRTLPLSITAPTPRFDIVNQYYEYQIDTIYKIQCNVDITFNSNQGILSNTNTIYKPIQYNSNLGYIINTSNISNSNIYNITIVPYGTASNIYTNNIYNSYSYSNTSNAFESFTFNYITNITRTSNILFPIINSNIINYTSNIIKTVVYFDVYGTDITIITSNQNHYDNYDFNTNKYIYHSDDSIVKIANPQISITKYLYNQPGPYIVNYRSNTTIHYNYNKFESYQKINKLLLYSSSNYSTQNLATLSNTILFINSNIGRPVNNSWSNTDEIYINSLSYNASCNINLLINNVPVNIKTIPAYNNSTIVRTNDIINVEIDPNTMKNLTPFNNIFSRDVLNFAATDINIINIDKGTIISGNSIITSFNINSANTINYLASYRYTDDIIQYFYSSNNVYASSNYTKTIKLIHTAGNQIQSYNIGLSSFNNTLNPHLLYYSIPGSNLGLRFKSIPSQVTLSPGNIFDINQTSNIQVYINKTGNYQLIYDVIDITQQTYPAINSYENIQLNIRAYEHYEFPLSNIDPISLGIQNIAYDLENVRIGTFWNKINSLKIQGTPFNTKSLNLITTSFPQKGYIKNAINYDDILNNKIQYISYNPLSDISGLSNDVMKFRLLYNSNIISPEYTLNIKNYVCRFNPRIINASSFDYTAAPGLKSYGMIQDNLEFTSTCNIIFPKNTLETRAISWKLSDYIFTENVATYNSTKRPILLNQNILRLTVDESDSVNFTSLLNYIIAGNNDTYFYITSPPEYGIIQDTITGNTVVRFKQSQLNTVVYQHIGQNLNTDTIKIAISSSPYDLSLNELTVQIVINALPTVINNYSQYIYSKTSNNALTTVNRIENETLGINTGYIHVFNNTLSNINITQNTIGYLDAINFQFNRDYIISSNAPYPQYGFDFSYNNSIEQDYINRLSKIPIYTNLYKNHFTGYFNQNTDLNDITYDANPNQSISYFITENSQLFNNNILSTLIQFENDMSLNTGQLEFLYNNKFTIKYYNKSTLLLELIITRYTLIVNIGTQTYTSVHEKIINNLLTTILVVNYDNFNDNYLSFYWNYDIGNPTNINLLKGRRIAVNLGNLDRVEVSVPIYDQLNYISSSNFVRKLDDGDLNASYNLRKYNTKHKFQNFELYVGNLAEIKNESHNVILGKSISVRGTNNICVGNTFSTSGEASLIIGNNIGGGGVNEINRSIIIGNDSFAESSVYRVISIGNSNLNYLRKNSDPVLQQSVNKFLSQYPIVIGNSIGIDKIDFNVNIGNVFLKTTIDPRDTTYGVNDQIYLGNSGEKVGIGYHSNVGLTDMLSVNGDISANTIKVNNFTINNLVNTVPSITAQSTDIIDKYYVVSSTGIYNLDGSLNVRLATRNDYNVIGICLRSSPLTIGISGHTKVWCVGKVTVGDFLATNVNGLAYSVRHQTITQTVTTTTATQQKYVVKKVVNGVPIFVGQTDTGNNSTTDNGITTSTTTPIELISSYTFAKSMTTWDPDNPVSWIESKYVDTGEFVGLIGCIVSY